MKKSIETRSLAALVDTMAAERAAGGRFCTFLPLSPHGACDLVVRIMLLDLRLARDMHVKLLLRVARQSVASVLSPSIR
jgi:hypothetical protein